MKTKVGRGLGRAFRNDGPARPPREGEAARRQGAGASAQRVKRLSGITAGALCVAVVAASSGVWAYVSLQSVLAETRANSLVTLVAIEDIEAGDSIVPEMFEAVAIPQSFRMQGALAADEASSGGSIVGKRALVDIPAGSQMAASFLSGTVGGSHLAAALDAGREGVTIAVDAETGLSGHLRPFDRVRVVSVDSASSGEIVTTTVCGSARVIALDDRLSGNGEGYASVTLEVDSREADDIRSSQSAGVVSLVLISALDGPVGMDTAHG